MYNPYKTPLDFGDDKGAGSGSGTDDGGGGRK